MVLYQNEDHDIKLFLRILQNECDEEFRIIQVHVKDTLINLVGMILRERYPLKQETEVKSMIEAIKKGFIEDWITEKVMDRMYD